MLALGIDPGTTQIGIGIIKYENSKFSCVHYGIIKNKGNDKMNYFRNTTEALCSLIKEHQPDIVGIEKLFFFNNQKTVMAVSEMRGAILSVLANHNLNVREFTPLEIKQAISGYGRADKKQIQRMVRLILNLNEQIKPDDAADALAIAICCVNDYTPFINK